MVNAASSVLARVINVGGLLWMLQYLLTRIPPEEFAVYPVLAAVMVFVPLFFSIFTGGVARYVVEAYAKGDSQRATALVSSIVPLLAAYSLGFLSLGLVFAWSIDSIFTIPPQMTSSARIMMMLLVISFALQMLLLPFGVGYHVRQRYVEFNLLQLGRDTFRILLLYLLLVEIGPAVIWVVVATVIADQVHLAVVTWRSVAMAPELRFRFRLYDRTMAGKLLSFGLWTTLGQLAGVMYVNAATLMLNLYGTALDVTNYHLGATCFRQLQSLIALARQPLQPALIAMHAKGERARMARTTLRGGRYGLWVALAVATPLGLYATEFIDLYIGERFSDAALILMLFMAIIPFSQPTVLLPIIAMAMAQVRAFNVAAFISTGMGLVLMLVFLLLGEMGAVGVTLALTLVTIVAQVVYFWPLQHRLAGFGFRELWREMLVPGLAPATAGAVAWGALKISVPLDDWIPLGLAVVAGGVVYMAVLLRFGFDTEDWRMIRSFSRKRGNVR